MNIQLKSTRVEELHLTFSADTDKDSFSFGFANGYSKNELDLFIVKFDVKIESERGYELKLLYVAEFQVDSEITDDFKESHFPKVNAPAIAYPYLRSYVSFVILNSGYEPLILPTINFQAMSNNQDCEPDD